MTGFPRARATVPIWGALLASAGAWSAHLLVSHFLVEGSCTPVAAAGGEGGYWIKASLLVVSVLSAAIALAGALFAASRRRSLERHGPGLERAAGLPGVVSALSAFFVLLIVLESLPLLLIGCGS